MAPIRRARPQRAVVGGAGAVTSRRGREGDARGQPGRLGSDGAHGLRRRRGGGRGPSSRRRGQPAAGRAAAVGRGARSGGPPSVLARAGRAGVAEPGGGGGRGSGHQRRDDPAGAEKSDALGARARWVRADVLETPHDLDGTADLVYTGRGALCWMTDLDAWAAVVARLLRPGGRLVLFEGHPLDFMWETEASGYALREGASYFEEDVVAERGFPFDAALRGDPSRPVALTSRALDAGADGDGGYRGRFAGRAPGGVRGAVLGPVQGDPGFGVTAAPAHVRAGGGQAVACDPPGVGFLRRAFPGSSTPRYLLRPLRGRGRRPGSAA